MENARVENFLDRLGFENINDENELGENALHYAVLWKDFTAAKALIDSGIILDKKGENGYTPLHEASEQNDADMVKLLVDSGANIYVRNDLGETPKDIAEEFAYFNLLDFLQKL